VAKDLGEGTCTIGNRYLLSIELQKTATAPSRDSPMINVSCFISSSYISTCCLSCFLPLYFTTHLFQLALVAAHPGIDCCGRGRILLGDGGDVAVERFPGDAEFEGAAAQLEFGADPVVTRLAFLPVNRPASQNDPR
jgi:hypothetical protein